MIPFNILVALSFAQLWYDDKTGDEHLLAKDLASVDFGFPFLCRQRLGQCNSHCCGQRVRQLGLLYVCLNMFEFVFFEAEGYFWIFLDIVWKNFWISCW